MINVLPHSDNKVEEVHFNMALLSLGDRGALCYKEEKMSEKKFWYKIEDSLYDEEEEKKEEKYVQLEFEFDEDLVAPI